LNKISKPKYEAPAMIPMSELAEALGADASCKVTGSLPNVQPAECGGGSLVLP
jgi:hypothetical protein